MTAKVKKCETGNGSSASLNTRDDLCEALHVYISFVGETSVEAKIKMFKKAPVAVFIHVWARDAQ